MILPPKHNFMKLRCSDVKYNDCEDLMCTVITIDNSGSSICLDLNHEKNIFANALDSEAIIITCMYVHSIG